VRSLGEYVNVVQALQYEWSDREDSDTGTVDGGLAHVWFRGHAAKEWELKPKIFRTRTAIRVVDEEELYSELLGVAAHWCRA
jgi:hypothetical protein